MALAGSNISLAGPNCGIGSLTEKNGFVLGAGPRFQRHIRCGCMLCINEQPDDVSHKPAANTDNPKRRILASSVDESSRSVLWERRETRPTPQTTQAELRDGSVDSFASGNVTTNFVP